MTAVTPTPILQFGTSRFLQAHADLFISEAMARDEAMGPITVVQTTANPESAARIAAMAGGVGFPVRIAGLEHGVRVERTVQVRSVVRALIATTQWPEVHEVAVHEASVILSNTGESGYALHPEDGAAALRGGTEPPRSFPAKLVALLHARWCRRADAPLTVLPCELISQNGRVLRDLVIGLARDWQAPDAFTDYLERHVVWGNSLVDRIVSAPLHPVGAVAEPYALWAIERQQRLHLPCTHHAIVVTDDLRPFERRKLHLLNLAHTMLAEDWLRDGAIAGRTVLDAMQQPGTRNMLERVWDTEVLPVFAADRDVAARDYVAQVRSRFLNPFLAHGLSDIAAHHAEKKRRRLQPMIDEGARLGLEQPHLRAAATSTLAPA